ncbi:uncharacterized protein LOC128213383 [Mya arenaria]|uniref:uncharacterized protein LOC128213383 n=1 Tax=Mya arenaria TaxID=6604 RepID=UPI0022E52B89|nr:uncharacterized protein LOC128213383 [Mya arenaria]
MSVLQYPGGRSPATVNTTSKRVYSVSSGFPQRKPRVRQLTGQSSCKRDVKENLQQATLINIVASVNIDEHSRHVPRRRNLGSVLSDESMDNSSYLDFANIIFPRNKAVSIPQPKQRVFNMPEETIQRKPVYYKHSQDREVRKDYDVLLFKENQAVKIKPPTREMRHRTSVQKFVKTLPNKPHVVLMQNSSFLPSKPKPGQDNSGRKSASSQGSRGRSSVSSSIRQLGTLKRPIETRVVRDIAKCDAIDLLDSEITAKDDGYFQNDPPESRGRISPQTSVPYIRTKSLPVLFPTKTTKTFPRSDYVPYEKQAMEKHHVFKDRPLSDSLRKQTPTSMYKAIMDHPNGASFETISINNGFNKPPDANAPIIHDTNSTKQNHHRVLAGLYHMNRARLRNSLTPSIGRATIHLHPQVTRHGVETEAKKQFQRSKTELHQAVHRVMSGRSEQMSEIESSKKSILSAKSGHSETEFSQRTPKRVQFNDSSSELNSEEGESVKDTDNCMVQPGGTSVISTPTNECRAYSQSMRPMSAKELLRIQQKILPANIPCVESHNTFLNSDSAITIQSFQQRSNSRISTASVMSEECLPNMDDDVEKEDKDTGERVKANDGDHTSENGLENELENQDETRSEEVEVVCGLEEDEEEKEDENKYKSHMSEIEAYVNEGKVALMNDNEQLEFYKIFKAVESNTYEGFEHKKIRRTSANSKGSDSKKALYVKVKLS